MPPQSESGMLPEQTEVVVVGGGIIGCATAYYLAKRGVPVALFEKGRVAGEQSSRNWGWVRKQGRDPHELPAIVEALRIWEGLQEELQEDIGWHQGGVTYLAETDEKLSDFEDWLAAAKPYQLDSHLLSPAETDDLLGQEGRRWKGALHTPSDGRAEPAMAVPAMAAPPSHDSTDVRWFSDASVVDGSSATLMRNDQNVRLTLNTSELEAGGAYTIWWIIFNNPEYCSDSCGEDDLPPFNPDGYNPAIEPSAAFATGHVIGNNGKGNFGASLQEGLPKGQTLFGEGLIDSRKAEIHIVVRAHGQPIPGIVNEMIGTYGGGCSEDTGGGPGAVGNDCADPQFAVFLP